MFVSRSGYLYFSSAQSTDQGIFYCTVTLAHSPGYQTSTSQPPIVTSLGVRLYVDGTGKTHKYKSSIVQLQAISITCKRRSW